MAITTTEKKKTCLYNLEILIAGVPDFHVFNMYIKFYINHMLFIIWFINLFLMHNFRLQKP